MRRIGAYDTFKKAFQDIVAPEIHSLRGDIRVINERLVALDQKIDGVETRLLDKIVDLDIRLTGKVDNLDARLSTRLDSLRNEMISELRRVDNRIDSLDREIQTAINIRERIVALEARRPA
jgi:transposase